MVKVKCWYCNDKSERGEMYCDEFSKPRKHYHHSCWPLELERRESVKKEREEWDTLLEYIKHVHNFTFIPPTFSSFLQDLRNGTVRFQGPVQKQYKQGIPYNVILEAYRLASDSILWSMQNKSFVNDLGALKYGLTIAKSNINQAHERVKIKTRTASLPVSAPESNAEYQYKPRQTHKDISQFLKE